MLHERIKAARPVAQKIADAEKSFNHSLQLIGELLTEIPRARQQFAGRVQLDTGLAASERLPNADYLVGWNLEACSANANVRDRQILERLLSTAGAERSDLNASELIVKHGSLFQVLLAAEQKKLRAQLEHYCYSLSMLIRRFWLTSS